MESELVVKRGRPRKIELTTSVKPEIHKAMNEAPKTEIKDETINFPPYTTKEELPDYPKDKTGVGIKASEPRYMLRRTLTGDYDFLAVYRKFRGVSHRLVKALKKNRNNDMAWIRKLIDAKIPVYSQFGEKEK